MQAFHVLIPLLLALPLRSIALEPGGTGTEPKSVAAVPALAKIAVLGASVSAGFGLDPTANPFAGDQSRVQIAQIVDASILAAHGAPHNGADLAFFTAPEAVGKRSIAAAKAEKPTAIVAIDFLFWMGYGAGSDDKRADRLDAGLKQLETFECPVLVGDLPDFRGAGTNPMYLPPSSIPPAEAIASMNKRIYSWAKEHKNVVIVPMGEMLRKVIVDEEFTVAGTTFGKGSKARLMQADNLHTTLEGTCGLWAIAVEAWRAADPTLPAEAFLIDIPALAKKTEEAAANAAPAKGKPAPAKGKPGKNAERVKPTPKKEKAGTGG